MGDIFLPLYGAHMAHNAALAVAAVEALRGAGLSGEVISEGLGSVAAPARLEAISSDPLLILDTAHNPQAITATLAGLREAFTAQPLIGVVAMMRDKDAAQVMELLADELDTIVVTTMTGNPRALTVDDLAAVAEEAFGPSRVRTAADPARAIDLARGLAEQGGDDAAVLVIGSVYLAGEVGEVLRRLDAELGL